jgi:hypothetical protein
MGAHDQVVQSEQGAVGWQRFGIGDIQAGSPESISNGGMALGCFRIDRSFVKTAVALYFSKR